MARTNIYAQITAEIRRQIEQNELPPESKIPSSTEMRQKYGVSHITALRVYRELSEAGLIFNKPGQGYFVRATQPQLDTLNGAIGVFLRPLRESQPDNYFNNIWTGIFRECALKNLNLISSYTTSGLTFNLQPAVFEPLKMGIFSLVDQVDGFILDERIPDPILQEIADKVAKPLVLVNRSSRVKQLNTVQPNHRGNLHEMFKLALAVGYENFVYLDSGYAKTNGFWRDFNAAWEQELQTYNIPPEQTWHLNNFSLMPPPQLKQQIEQLYHQLQPQKARTLLVVGSATTARYIWNLFTANRWPLAPQWGLVSAQETDLVTTLKPCIATTKQNPIQLGELSVQAVCEWNASRTRPAQTYQTSVNFFSGETF